MEGGIPPPNESLQTQNFPPNVPVHIEKHKHMDIWGITICAKVRSKIQASCFDFKRLFLSLNPQYLEPGCSESIAVRSGHLFNIQFQLRHHKGTFYSPFSVEEGCVSTEIPFDEGRAKPRREACKRQPGEPQRFCSFRFHWGSSEQCKKDAIKQECRSLLLALHCSPPPLVSFAVSGLPGLHTDCTQIVLVR